MNNRGYILLISVIIVLSLGVMASYFLNLSESSLKISQARQPSPQTYFLAEAGIQEAIWKINNDEVWSDLFEKGKLKHSFTRKNVFSQRDEYTVYATSTAKNPAVAEITSTGIIWAGTVKYKRMIKTEVAKSTGYWEIWPTTLFSGGKAGCDPGDTSGHIHIDIPGDPSKYKKLTLYYNGVLYATIPFPKNFPKKDFKWTDPGQVESIQNHQSDESGMILSIKFNPDPQNFTINIDASEVGAWDTKKGFSSSYSYEEPGACKKKPTGKGDIVVKNINLIVNGIAESNNDIEIDSADVTINDGSIGAVNKISIDKDSTLLLNNSSKLENIYSRPYPSLDFDSSSTTSLKSRATQIFTPQQFKDALKSKTDFTGIVYVTGNVDLKDQNLTIRGMLVIDGKFTVANSALYKLTSLQDASVQGSGILAKEEITIDSDLLVNGLIFSYKNVTLEAQSADQEVNGGIIGWNAIMQGKSTRTVTLTYDDELVGKTLGLTLLSAPLIQVNHWEEQY